jgi:hypothetical protein
MLAAAESGADSESMMMIEAIKSSKERRTAHRMARQSAADTMLHQYQRAADKLRDLADKQKERALWNGLSQIVPTVGGAALGACLPGGPGAKVGAQIGQAAGQMAHGIYQMVTAGDEAKIQAKQKEIEARIEAARQDVDHHREVANETHQSVNSAMQHLQRFVEVSGRANDTAARNQ